jgi:hypothetical protein
MVTDDGEWKAGLLGPYGVDDQLLWAGLLAHQGVADFGHGASSRAMFFSVQGRSS